MTYDQAVAYLVEDWLKAGIRAGDTVLIHSSISRTLKRVKEWYEEPSPELILDSFLSVLGEQGTLILPLFNFDFTQGIPFDIRSTKSQMGVLTELARQHPEAVRTGHPIYSFAVIGHHAKLFMNVNNKSGYGKDSPFGILHQLGGKIGVLDLPDQNSMTFYHYVEECFEVDYRFHKIFSGIYVDINGNSSQGSYSLFVRDIDRGVETHVDPMGEILWSKGLYTGCRPRNKHGLRVVSTIDLYREVALILESKQAEGLLYRVVPS